MSNKRRPPTKRQELPNIEIRSILAGPLYWQDYWQLTGPAEVELTLNAIDWPPAGNPTIGSIVTLAGVYTEYFMAALFSGGGWNDCDQVTVGIDNSVKFNFVGASPINGDRIVLGPGLGVIMPNDTRNVPMHDWILAP